MLNKQSIKFASILIITIVLVLGVSISLQSLLAAWEAPTANPPASNVKPPLFNAGDDVTPVFDNQLTINDSFYVGANNFFVDSATGNIGIGTLAPGAKLDVAGGIKASNNIITAGSIKIAGDIAGCDASKEGTIRYNSGTKKIELCNSIAWAEIAGAAACDPVPGCTGKCNVPDICGGTCPDNCVAPDICSGGVCVPTVVGVPTISACNGRACYYNILTADKVCADAGKASFNTYDQMPIGSTANNVQKWDGISWSDWGTLRPINNLDCKIIADGRVPTISACGVSNNRACYFDAITAAKICANAGHATFDTYFQIPLPADNAAWNVQKWDGTSWFDWGTLRPIYDLKCKTKADGRVPTISACGVGNNRPCYFDAITAAKVCTSAGLGYVGVDTFDQMPAGNTANNVQKWDGASWSDWGMSLPINNIKCKAP